MTSLSPIIIFAYNRLTCLKLTVEALKRCDLAIESNVIVFSDAPRKQGDDLSVKEVRKYLSTIKGFKSLKIIENLQNKGLAASVIEGITNTFSNYKSVIVLEDDTVPSENFLHYMNQALEYYRTNKKIFSISGYSIPIKASSDYTNDVYFTPRASSWGWATWDDRWEGIDWEVADYAVFRKNRQRVFEFNRGGSDMTNMLDRQMKGRIDSWAIRWCYHQFRAKTFTVYPLISKINNIGFSNQATHSDVYNRYNTYLDDGFKKHFVFNEEVKLQPFILNQFQDFFSVRTRMLGKLKTFLYKAGIMGNNNDD